MPFTATTDTATARARLITLLLAISMLASSCALMTRVAQSNSGGWANAAATDVATSGDGRFVVFESTATNLDAGDTDSQLDVYLRDLQAGTTELISADPSGMSGNGASSDPDISADGRFVTFSSTASDLVTGDTNGRADIFVRDRQSGVTERVSETSAGLPANGSSFASSVSDDGRFIAFQSVASNLFAGDLNGATDVLVKDLLNGLVIPVSRSVAPIGPADGASTTASISADGSTVVYQSTATNLVAGDTNGQLDVFAWDRVARTNVMVSVDANGVSANGPSRNADVNGDGSVVVFESTATDLVRGDTNGFRDVFRRDLTNSSTAMLSIDDAGGPSNFPSEGPKVNGDGTRVTFHSSASDLVSGDIEGFADVFVWHANDLTRVSVTPTFTGAIAGGDSSSFWPDISDDGSSVAFETIATNLTGESGANNNGTTDVVARAALVPQIDEVEGTLTLGVWQAVTITGQDFSPDATIVMDSADVSVTSASTTEIIAEIRPTGDNGPRDLWVVDPQPQLGQGAFGAGDRVTLSIRANPVTIAASGAAVLDGFDLGDRYAVFATADSTILPGDTDTVADVFRFDRETGAIDWVSVDSGGAQIADAADLPTISDDGRYVAFQTTVAGTDNRTVWVKDMVSGALNAQTASICGAAAGDLEPVISGNGQWLTYLEPWTTCSSERGVRRSLVGGTPFWVTVTDNGMPASALRFFDPDISDAGRFVAATDDVGRVLRYDTSLGVSDPSYDLEINAAVSGNIIPVVTLSGDGHTATFRSNPADVYLWDDIGQTANIIATPITGETALDHDGDRVGFRSTVTTAWPDAVGETFGDQYVLDVPSGVVTRIGNGQHAPAISPGGACGLVRTYAGGLQLVDIDGSCDL